MKSSWISSIVYRSLPDGTRYLAVFIAPAHQPICAGNRIPVAMLYGPDIPSWLPGLLSAGTGKRSIGLAYNRLLKGKHSYQRIEGAEKVTQLKAMLNKSKTKETNP